MANHTDFGSFALAIAANAEEIKAREEKKMLDAVNGAYALAVQLTPVDEGLAKNNWQVQNKLDENITHSNSTRDRSKTKFSNPMYLTNNLKYIKRLDEGHSAQRPEGMSTHILEFLSRYLTKGR